MGREKDCITYALVSILERIEEKREQEQSELFQFHHSDSYSDYGDSGYYDN